ncbi:MAG TPA: hypothetical protein DF383_06975 [Deltaproteobacteria bacterium]|nr:hypothetical protein [Deltaproteobacteria bacterium]
MVLSLSLNRHQIDQVARSLLNAGQALPEDLETVRRTMEAEVWPILRAVGLIPGKKRGIKSRVKLEAETRKRLIRRVNKLAAGLV